jgi:hypothetical protein
VMHVPEPHRSFCLIRSLIHCAGSRVIDVTQSNQRPSTQQCR